MANYGTQYIMSFTSELGELFEVYFDYLNYTGSSTNIIGTDGSVIIRNTTGDRSTLDPYIRGTECLLEIFARPDDNLSIANFLSTIANNIRITVYQDSNYTHPYYQGFVAVEDLSQSFMDPPYTISIRALDGLGLLKGVDLVDTNNLKFYGNMSIIQWVAQILYKTDQTIPIRVFFNIFNSTLPTLTVFDYVYLNSITFSEGDSFNINAADPAIDTNALTADDCYNALEKIMRCFKCTLFQEDGYWNVVNLWEYANPNGYGYTVYNLGTVSSVILGNSCQVAFGTNSLVSTTISDVKINNNYDIKIGKKQKVFPVSNDLTISLQQPLKWLQLNYAYNQSQNKVINQDLTDIALGSVINSGLINSGAVDPTGNINLGYTNEGNPILFNMVFNNYALFGWSNHLGPIGTPAPPTTNAYIQVINDNLGYEYERFLMNEEATGFTFLQSTCVLVDSGDKFNITGSFRTRSAVVGGNNDIMAYCLFYGDDGTFWTLVTDAGNPTNNPPKWVPSNSNFTINTGFISYDYNGQNADIWISFSVSNSNNIPTVPSQGKIVVLLGSNIVGATQYWYKDIQITVSPFLSGTALETIAGDYNYSSQNNALSIRDSQTDDVEISDSPKRYFKGALINSSGFLLPATWYRRGYNTIDGVIVNGVFIPGLRFTQIMEYLKFENLDRTLQYIEGTLKGLTYYDANFKVHPLGLLNSYFFVDPTPLTLPTKKFRCTSYEKNLVKGTFKGTFVEVLNDQNDNGFSIPDIYTFGYTFNSIS